jgi:predicted metalloprotease with PDZ domain
VRFTKLFRNAIVMMIVLVFTVRVVAQETRAIQLRVDLTDAPRRLFHVTELLPVHAGESTISYPQWIPGQELAAGAIDNLTGLVFRAGSLDGAMVPWRRDLDDPFAFHVHVPNGVDTLAVSFDVLAVSSRANTTGTKHTSMHVVMLEPSDVILYPSHTRVRDIPVTASIHLPSDWRAATALRVEGSDAASLNGPDTTFKTVSVEQFVDSPILAGDHCRQYPLAPDVRPAHTLDVCAEKAADLELHPDFLEHMNALVEQSTKMFVGHHFEHYDFLVADSSHMDGDSEEHGQSADYIVRSLDTSDRATASFLGYLLPHEFVHSWCGKYRRPAGEATPDYQTPMQNDLIWVYEGLTQYLGDVLTARTGFRTPAETVSELNFSIFRIDQPGRRWRSVQDTADASAILRGNTSVWSSWRLSQDYYLAGALLWLDADVRIRQMSHGAKSLDDFAALFFAPPVAGSSSRDTGPGVVPYGFADVVKALNAIAPYDWKNFWETRLNAHSLEPLIAGLEPGGYTYVHSETMTLEEASYFTASHMAEMFHSLGFEVRSDATLRDVWMGSPAFAAGLGPGDKLISVNGKPYTADVLVAAVREAKTTTTPIVLTTTREDESMTFEVPYHGGLKYSALERNSHPDLLTTAIFQPQ